MGLDEIREPSPPTSRQTQESDTPSNSPDFWDDALKEIGLQLTGGNRPSLKLRDENGIIRAALGSTELQVISTGETTHRPPSSLVLFDKEGKVIWEAP